MADFSIQNAAFTGFGVVRKHRRYLVVWGVFALVTSLVSTGAVVEIAGPAVMRLQSLTVSETRNPATILALLSHMAPAYLVLIPAIVFVYGVLCAAMNRAILRPEDLRFAYLAVGADELRQVGVLLLGGMVFAVSYILGLGALLVTAVLVGSMTHVSPAASGFIAVFLACAAMAWLAVRLSLASALTFESRRVNLFGSWTLTRGRFWPIFGTYILVLALAAVIFFLTSLVILAAAAVAAGGDLRVAFAPPDLRSLGSYLTAGNLVQLILGAGVSALLWPVVLTPPAAILRQISIANPQGIAARRLP